MEGFKPSRAIVNFIRSQIGQNWSNMSSFGSTQFGCEHVILAAVPSVSDESVAIIREVQIGLPLPLLLPYPDF